MKCIKVSGFALCSLIAGVAYSHSGAVGIVKERMDAMKDMGDKSKVVADMFKGKEEFNRAALADAADAFVMHGNKMTELFPDNEASRVGSETEALPRIWDEWRVFSDQINKFILLSENLASVASTTEDTGTLKKAFYTTIKSCRVCHKRFRKPK